jgi:hypothetical protein
MYRAGRALETPFRCGTSGLAAETLGLSFDIRYRAGELNVTENIIRRSAYPREHLTEVERLLSPCKNLTGHVPDVVVDGDVGRLRFGGRHVRFLDCHLGRYLSPFKQGSSDEPSPFVNIKLH